VEWFQGIGEGLDGEGGARGFGNSFFYKRLNSGGMIIEIEDAPAEGSQKDQNNHG
jgi:hypothetical protein